MKLEFLGAFLVSSLAVGVAASQSAGPATPSENASPIYGVTIPEGYRDWKFIAPAQEAPPLDELRAVLGNDIAVDAYKKGTLPFPDGSILVKLAYKRKQSTEFAPATVPGAPTTVQVMVKDSKKYPDSHGWGFGRFIDGKPVDIAQHETCLSCHVGNVKDHDYVFTRYAP
ncbi:cytochrome P460 family protein [Rhizobium sp. P40RR-XXII]|uniref:cytochrome P460 family protein n=1 Tax=unclassified Rhizobium TaxID=2613769 RepID=UPI0014565386|nr:MULTISPECIES: cytochrome P460 family protein [unclassified Rhizobium]NLR88461.1 cytochrome P460 family protein [Rhizobium sp. P28RR-XV]NLS17537.1 cytochrome P460 family protein [Rhizobium sp. P40RR-XXII]